MQPAAFGEVAVDLAVPGGVVALPDKGGELRQFIGGKGIYGSLYFGGLTAGMYSERGENAILRVRLGQLIHAGRRS